MTTFPEQEELRAKILQIVAHAYPDRAAVIAGQIKRWFAWSWRNPTRSPDTERCSLCIRRRADVGARRNRMKPGVAFDLANKIEEPDVRICMDCLDEAGEMARDARYPSRDMVRSDSMRALVAAGAEEAAGLLDALAADYPALERVSGKCSACSNVLDGDRLAGGVHARLCPDCIGELRRQYAIHTARGR